MKRAGIPGILLISTLIVTSCNRDWLTKTFEIVRASLEEDARTIADPAAGMIRVEASFLDWRRQTYPLWMEPADFYGSLNLCTNAAYFQPLKVAGITARNRLNILSCPQSQALIM